VINIIAVVDAFDAITSGRPYRRGLDFNADRAEIVIHSGSKSDPDIVSVFDAVLDSLRNSLVD